MPLPSPLIISLLAATLPASPSGADTREAIVASVLPLPGKLTLLSPAREHRAGRVLQGDVVSHLFEFRVEEGPVRVTRVRPSAGCTVVPLEVREPNEGAERRRYEMGDPIAENSTLLVEARLGTSSAAGPKRVHARLEWSPLGESSDGQRLTGAAEKQEQLRAEAVWLSADVRPFFLVDPPFHDLGEIPFGEARSATSLIRTSTGRPFRLDRVSDVLGLALLNHDDSSPARVWLEPLHARPDGTSTHWRATFDVPESNPIGRGGMFVRARFQPALDGGIDAASPGSPALDRTVGITASYRVVGPYSFEEDFVSFGLFRPGETVERILNLRVPDGDFDPTSLRLRIEEVAEDPQFRSPALLRSRVLCTVIPPTEDGAPVQVKLRIVEVPAECVGVLRGRLAVETGDVTQPWVHVRFSGVCRQLR
ncbi:MAG: hypothetical protein AAGG01_23690 [Planctomycetota bacterium]